MDRKASRQSSRIHALTGVDGAGKSSIGGATIRAFGADYYNPDEVARALIRASPHVRQTQANSAAWQQGTRMLEEAIARRLDFAFETTLAGGTIARLLSKAAAEGAEVRAWYVGLSDPTLHVERVEARVRKGGHAISEADIRRRFEHSRLNLIRLLPGLATLRVYDNSEEADPAEGNAPGYQLILHVERGKIVAPTDLARTPDWSKPIVAAALERHPRPIGLIRSRRK